MGAHPAVVTLTTVCRAAVCYLLVDGSKPIPSLLTTCALQVRVPGTG